jgi:hypothetical protein
VSIVLPIFVNKIGSAEQIVVVITGGKLGIPDTSSLPFNNLKSVASDGKHALINKGDPGGQPGIGVCGSGGHPLVVL